MRARGGASDHGAAVLGTPSPIAGDVEEIDAAAAYARDIVGDCADFQVYVYRASGGLARGEGEAIDRLREKVDGTLDPGSARLSGSAEAAGDAFVEYAAEVDRIHTEARALLGRVEDPLSDALAGTTLEDVDAADRERWNALADERRSAERRLVNSLRDTTLGQLITLGAAAGGARAAVAHGFAGELWGASAESASLARSHELLDGLFPGGDGSGAWSDPPDADVVAAWWSALSEADRERLVREAPWVVGNLPGLPFETRDEANRILLAHHVAHPEELGEQGREALAQIMRVIRADDGNPPVSIVALDLDREVPLAAIGYGDLDAAGNLTWEVPGMYNDLDRGLAGWDAASRNLHAEQTRLLRDAGRGEEGAATIAFFGYDTPNALSVLSADDAQRGAARLAAEIDGTSTSRGAVAAPEGPPPVAVSVLAHSYGTTVTANALLETAHPVRAFTMIGSAGLDSERLASLEQLLVERDEAGRPRVYTTMAGSDGLAPIGSGASGRLQPNPGSAGPANPTIGGAWSFSSDGEGELGPTTGHSIGIDGVGGYLDGGTQSLRNVAATTLGLEGAVSGGLTQTEHRSAGTFDGSAYYAQLGWR